jgi:DNA-binding IclR family transcriptional regulator
MAMEPTTPSHRPVDFYNDRQLPDSSAPKAHSRDPIDKAFQILARLADGSAAGVGVREIAHDLGFALGTTHRLLATLESRGLVSRTTAGKYRLGMEILRLSWVIAARFSLVEAARPELEELVRQCNETALLALYDPTRHQMMFVLEVESGHPLRYVVKLHEWLPVYAAASGLAILSFVADDERKRILSGELAPLTANTILDPDEIERETAQIRAQGYAISHNQRLNGAVGIAAPIRAHNGQVLGDVAVTIPELRFRPELEGQLSRAVISTASKLSTTLPSNYFGMTEVAGIAHADAP